MTIENKLNNQELRRIVELYEEAWSCESIALRCTDIGREEFTPSPQTIRNYLHRINLWPKGTKRPLQDRYPGENRHALATGDWSKVEERHRTVSISLPTKET